MIDYGFTVLEAIMINQKYDTWLKVISRLYKTFMQIDFEMKCPLPATNSAKDA